MSQTASESAPSRFSILGNTAWLLLPRAARIGTGLVVGVLVTRHLGPERFGELSFALALAGLFGPLSKLGLDGFVVRDLVREPAARRVIVRTAARIKVVASLLAWAVCLAAVALLRPAEPQVLIACALFFLHFVFRAGEVAEFSLRAQRRMRPIGLAQTAGLLVAAVASLACIAVDASTAWFAAPLALEGLVSTALAMRADTDGGAQAPPGPRHVVLWSAARARRLLRESWPLLLSSMLALVALQIDQVMLGMLRGQDELGHYASAVRLSSLLYVLPMVAAQAAQPGVIAARELGTAAYRTHLQGLFTLLVAVSYALALPLSLLSTWLVTGLYGDRFESAGPVLGLLAWAGPLVAVAAPRGLWLTNESLARHALLANFTAAACNVGLNMLLIPRLGIMGAAYATVVSYVVSHLLATLLFPGGRHIFNMQLRALALVDLPRAAAWALSHRRAI